MATWIPITAACTNCGKDLEATYNTNTQGVYFTMVGTHPMLYRHVDTHEPICVREAVYAGVYTDRGVYDEYEKGLLTLEEEEDGSNSP